MNVIKIENYGVSSGGKPDIVEGYYPGSQGPRTIHEGSSITLGARSTNEFVGLVT